MWSGNIKSAIASVRSSKWRSMLTMTGMIVGISLVVTTVSLGEGLKRQIVGQVDKLGSNVLSVRSGKLVTRKSSGGIETVNILAFLNSSTLTPKDVAVLTKVPSVTDVTPINFVTSSVSSDSKQVNNAFVLGTSSGLPRLLNQKVDYGEFFSDEDASSKFAVIGSDLALTLFKQLNPVGHTVNISGQDYIVHGVLAPSSGGLLSVGQTDFNSAVFINFDQSTRITSGTNILQILLKSQRGNPEATIKDVQKTMLASHSDREDFSVLKQEELLRVANDVVNKLTGFISALAAISLLVGGIGIMNIMLSSVTERTREIGIRKAIGATNRQILRQFLTEGLVLTVTGGVLGLIISLLIYAFLRIYTNFEPVLTLPIVLLAAIISIAVGLFFSIAPALKAASKDPIEALRGD